MPHLVKLALWFSVAVSALSVATILAAKAAGELVVLSYNTLTLVFSVFR